MDERTHRSLTRTIFAIVTIALAVLVLSACGVGGDDEEPEDPTEPADVVESTPVAESVVDLTGDSSPADVSSAQAPTDVPVQGTPADGATPTPAIVVSAPPVAIPTSVPTPPATPGPAGATALAETEGDDVVIGDGTGGAVTGAEPGQAEPDGATPATQPDAADTTVGSCEVASYPPYTGDDATRLTTIDVNFRAGPGTDCDSIGDPLSAGTVVEVLSSPVTREGDDQFLWVAVSIDGSEGWLATEFLEPTAE